METEVLLNGINVSEYRVTTGVDLKEDQDVEIADFYFAKYDIKVLNKWQNVDIIGVCDFDDDIDKTVQKLKNEMKTKWGIDG